MNILAGYGETHSSYVMILVEEENTAGRKDSYDLDQGEINE